MSFGQKLQLPMPALPRGSCRVNQPLMRRLKIQDLENYFRHIIPRIESPYHCSG
jgi:hypothetical protein